jgi:hypothetical protein
MRCQRVKVGNTTAIVCGSRPRLMLCRCGSGKLPDLLCDWKVPTKRSGTCDAKLCADCSDKPAADKDLCPQHAAEWKARQGLGR